MQVKIFHGRSRERLENDVNAWLTEHNVRNVTMQLAMVAVEDSVEYILEHTLILLYTPVPERAESEQ